MSKEIEEWRPVPEKDYEELYEVSDWGNVLSLNYNHTGKPKLLTKTLNVEGYHVVTLTNKKKQKQRKVHILVAKAFIPNPENKKEVGHLKTLQNGLEDRTANEVWNLAWMTREENANYGTIGERLSESKKGENNPMKRPEVAAKVAEKQREIGKKRYEENPELFLKTINSNRKQGDEKRKIKVDQLDNNTGEFIKTWPSAADIEKELGISHGNVASVCRGKSKSAGGFKFRYHENR